MKKKKKKKEGQEPKVKIPRTFVSPAYLVEVEPKTFGLFRNITQLNEETGVKEKVGKPIPIGMFRECEGDEQPDIRTELNGRAMMLKRIS